MKENILKVMIENKWGYIDKTGKEITKLKYSNTSDFSEGKAIVKSKNGYGVILNSGKEIIEPKYFNIGGIGTSFYEDRALIIDNNSLNKEFPILKFGFIDKNMKINWVGKVRIESADDYNEEF